MTSPSAVFDNASPAAEAARPDPDKEASASSPSDQRDVSPVSDPTPEQAPQRDYVREFINASRGIMGRTESPEAPPASESTGPESETTRGTTDEVQPSAEVAGVAEAPKKEPPAAEPRAREESGTLTLTQEELDRKVQAEADRRLDKFQREQAKIRKAEEERRLRDNDPYGYAQMMREREAEQVESQRKMKEVVEFASGQVREYDRQVLDPLFLKLPKEKQQEILSDIEEGIPARGKAATAALEALEKMWTQRGISEARKRLLEDQAFVKEVLARYAGNRQEPDPVPAVSSAPVALEDPNDYIRSAVRGMRNR